MLRRYQLCRELEALRQSGRGENDPDVVALEDSLIQFERERSPAFVPVDLVILEEPYRPSSPGVFAVQIDFDAARLARLQDHASRAPTTELSPLEQEIEDVAEKVVYLSAVRHRNSPRVCVQFTAQYPAHFLYNSRDDMLLDENRYTVAQFNRFSADVKHTVLVNNYRWLLTPF